MAAAPQSRAQRRAQQNQPADVQTQETPASTVAESLAADEPDDSVFDEPAARPTAEARPPLDFLNSLYPPDQVRFKTKIREANKPWSNGTVSQSVAEVVIPVHDPITGLWTGYEMRSAKIVKKTNGGKSVLDLQMPSTGTSFRTPVFDTDIQRSEDGYNRWRKQIAKLYETFRIKEVAADKSNGATIVTDSGIATDADTLAALGF